MSNPQLPPSPHQICVEQRKHGCNAALSDGSTPSQGTAVSTLTADSSLVDLLVDSFGGEDTTLLPLTSIFHCPFIKESPNHQNGKKGWLCKWCGKMFLLRHQSQAIWCVLKIKLGDIDICSCPLFTRSMRIDTVHCMPEARNKRHQRSAPTLKLMMLWQSNKHRNLIEEGNIVLGSNLNNSTNNDEDEIFFQEAAPVDNGTDDEMKNRHQVIDVSQISVPYEYVLWARLAKARR